MKQQTDHATCSNSRRAQKTMYSNFTPATNTNPAAPLRLCTSLLHQPAFTPDTFYTRHLLLQTPFTAGNFLHQTTFTPDTFYTRRLLHQTPFTPTDCYNRHLLHQTPFTSDTFYTRRLLHQTPFHQTPVTPSTFYNRQLLHQTTFTLNTVYTRHLLHQTTFNTRHLLHQRPFIPGTSSPDTFSSTKTTTTNTPPKKLSCLHHHKNTTPAQTDQTGWAPQAGRPGWIRASDLKAPYQNCLVVQTAARHSKPAP